MTNWAFESWSRIFAGAALLSVLYGIVHVLGRVVTGLPGLVNASTLAIAAFVFVGYLAVGAYLHWNPLARGE